jgi:hypothetical protein|tara:strand:- start:16198 stop:17004 length:807 start_codon:yes stop_codon:yes gene_type:complete
MLLATVTNDKYFFNAVNLIDSYKANSFNKQVLFYSLNLSERYKEYLKKRYASQVILEDVPKICDHAHDITTFFYKVSAIKSASKYNQDFIYSDATNEIVKFTSDLKNDVDRLGGRIILPYKHSMLKNKYWTTKRCFKKMCCESEEYLESPQHWAGLQIYAANEQNNNLINDMYEYMLDLEVAGPPVGIKNPDGPDSTCLEHRCDQSVLSILLKKHNMVNDFNIELAYKYGDQQTLVDFDPSYNPKLEDIVIFSRKTKFNDYSDREQRC